MMLQARILASPLAERRCRDTDDATRSKASRRRWIAAVTQVAIAGLEQPTTIRQRSRKSDEASGDLFSYPCRDPSLIEEVGSATGFEGHVMPSSRGEARSSPAVSTVVKVSLEIT